MQTRNPMNRQRSAHIGVVVPAFNEIESLPEVLSSIPDSVLGISVKVIVIDDGSTDGTSELAGQNGVRFIHHLRNQGQGAALSRGFRVAFEEGCLVAVSLDADGQHDPGDIKRLVRPILEGRADFTLGSRFRSGDTAIPIDRALGIRLLSMLTSLVIGQRIEDVTNGFRAIGGQWLNRFRLIERRFNAPELLVQARKLRMKIREIPITVYERTAGQSKKPRIRYMVGLIFALFRATLTDFSN